MLLSGCYTTQQTTPRTQQQTPEQRIWKMEQGTDSLLEKITSITLEEPTLENNKTGVHTSSISTSVRDAFAKRYFGLSMEARELYLIEDLLKANQNLHDTRKELSTLQNYLDQELPRRHRSRYRTNNRSPERYRAQVQHLKQERDEYRQLYNQEKNKPPKEIREVHYETRIIEQAPLIIEREGEHPVEEQEIFLRIGDDYFTFPFGSIVCPSLDSPRRACVDVQDVLEDFKHRGYELYNSQQPEIRPGQ